MNDIDKLGANDIARTYLLAYCAMQMDTFQAAPHHVAIAKKLEAIERGEITRLIIMMPPRHGKTLLAAEFFPAWYMGRNPERQVIYATYAYERATDVGRSVRNQLQDELFKEVFPGCNLSPDSKGANKLSTLEMGNYFSVGVGGPITGRGAHLFIIDDPIKGREDAESATKRRRLVEWFQSVAYTRLMPQNAIVLIMTRWHFDDLAGWLMAEKSHENWDILELPAIADEDDDVIGRVSGDALWMDAYPLPRLKTIRNTIGTREWSALFQQRPVPEGGGMVQLDWFNYYDRKALNRQLLDPNIAKKNKKIKQVVCSWDTAFKEEQMNDPSACTVWGIADDGYYLLWILNERLSFPKLKSAVIKMYNRNMMYALGQVPVLIEDKASGQSLIQELRSTTKIPVIPIKADANKQVRMSEVTALIEAGKVYLPNKVRWLVEYESQLAQFPFAKFDDLVDSTSQFLRWAAKPQYVASKRPLFWK